jgi:hypothetical protein
LDEHSGTLINQLNQLYQPFSQSIAVLNKEGETLITRPSASSIQILTERGASMFILALFSHAVYPKNKTEASRNKIIQKMPEFAGTMSD